MSTSLTTLVLPFALSGVNDVVSADDELCEPTPSECPDETPDAFARSDKEQDVFAREPSSPPMQWRHRAKNTVAPRLSGALNAFMASCILCIAGCGGEVPGDERKMWLQATTIEPQELFEGPAFAGTDQELGFGFLPGSYYAKPADISAATSEEQAALFGMLFDELSEKTMNFSHPDVSRTIANNLYLVMTDKTVWPTAFFSAGMASAYRLQVLNGNFVTISDCAKGPCQLQDVIAVKGGSLRPTSRDRNALTPSERGELAIMAGTFSEEVGHDFFASSDAAFRESLIQTVKGLWEAGSSGMEDDTILAGAWFSGGIAKAISEEGIKKYSLRDSLLAAMSEAYPAASEAQRFEMEVALISWLQLICNYASALIGSTGKSYLEFYRKNDAAAGKSIGAYESYRERFMEHEAFAHLVAFSSTRQVYPSLLRTSLDGPFWPHFLDTRFNDGFFSDVRIMNNPYLSNADALRTLVSGVIPLMLKIETGKQ